MSAEFMREMKDKVCQDYFAEWKLSKVSSIETKSLQTPAFYPLPGTDLKFCLEIWYQNLISASVTSFRLSFLKLSDSNSLQPNIKVSVHIKVMYYDRSLFKEFSTTAICLKEMSSLKCIDDVSKTVDEKNRFITSSHGRKINHDVFYVECRLMFHNRFPVATSLSHDLCSLNKFKKIMHNFSFIREADVLTDIVIRVENEWHPAHKFVLAAYSPVFLKMITSDFREAKTSIIKITDCKADLFKIFLNYLYSGVIQDLSWLILKQLYVLADKYDVRVLKDDCILEITKSHLCEDNICEVLNLAYNFDDESIKLNAKSAVVCLLQRNSDFCERWKEYAILNPLIAYEVSVDVYKSSEYK